MDDKNLDELVVMATENDDDAILKQILEILADSDLSSGNIPGHIDFMLESWGDELTTSRANFCVAVAEMNIKDTTGFRNALGHAIKKLLPPFLSKTGYIRSFGLRENDVPLKEIVARYNKLPKIRNGLLAYLPSSNRWGIINTIDGITGTVGINALSGNGSYAIPLSMALSEVIMFEPATDTARLAGFPQKSGFTSNEYREMATRRAVLPLSAEEIKKMAKSSLTPNSINANEFEFWWCSSSAATAAGGKRRACDSRSLKELHILLSETPNKPFEADEITALADFFARVKAETAERERVSLAESIAMLTERCKSDTALNKILSPLKGVAVFLPNSLHRMNLNDFDIWGEVPVKMMDLLVRAVKSIYSSEEVTYYALHLPLRCLNTFCDAVDDHLLTEAIKSARCPSCDILLWLWKNRKNHSDELLQELNFNNVLNALAIENLPKAWLAYQRELKKTLMEKADFQQFLLDNHGSNLSELTVMLQSTNVLITGERQSILVKLSRHSNDMKVHLESGAGGKVMAQGKAQAVGDAHPHHGPLLTSTHSHLRISNELDDILNVQVPENREALKVARAHGDFRENSEFDAAKERRNYLSRRRTELERDITNIQVVDFNSIKPDESVIMGSSVTIETQDGEQTLHIVGALDGNPEKNMIAYRAKLGEILLDHRIGDTVVLPDGKNAVVKAIKPLPKAVLAILAE